MLKLENISNENLSVQRKLGESLFLINLSIPNLLEYNMEKIVDANTFYRFSNPSREKLKINLLPLNSEATQTSEYYDTYEELYIYNSLLKDEREEGYYYIDLRKDGKTNWKFRLRSREIINLVNSPKEIEA